jgi:hypothetical protein
MRKKMRSSQPHEQIHNHHFIMHLSLLLKMRSGNAHGATLTKGENYLNFFTSHSIWQLLVEPSLDSCLSQHDSLRIPCDKDKFCDN